MVRTGDDRAHYGTIRSVLLLQFVLKEYNRDIVFRLNHLSTQLPLTSLLVLKRS